MGFLKTELFGGFTVMQIGIAVVGLIIVVVVLKALFGAKQAPPAHTVQVTCECGWHGTVSKFNRVCRKCNKKL